MPSGSLRNPCRSSIRYALSMTKAKEEWAVMIWCPDLSRIKTIQTGTLRNLGSSIRPGFLCNRARPLDCGSAANVELPLFRGVIGSVISAGSWETGYRTKKREELSDPFRWPVLLVQFLLNVIQDLSDSPDHGVPIDRASQVVESLITELDGIRIQIDEIQVSCDVLAKVLQHREEKTDVMGTWIRGTP